MARRRVGATRFEYMAVAFILGKGDPSGLVSKLAELEKQYGFNAKTSVVGRVVFCHLPLGEKYTSELLKWARAGGADVYVIRRGGIIDE